jgi:4-amino-4-deoxy-L-arabinose transferase-like glycosyltransferase
MTEAPVPRLGARTAILLFLLAVGVRLAATAFVGFSTVRFGDVRAYLGAAETLARTGHYPRQTDYHSFRAPGYPVFLVAATFGDPHRIALAKVANALLSGLSVLLLAALSAHLFRSRRVALGTGLAAALDPGLVLHATDIQSEPLFLVLLIAAVYALLGSADRPSSNLGVLAGVALALAALTRPSALALAPLLAAPLWDRRWPPRARLHLAGSALLGFVLALAPWTVRNALVYRELVPVNDFAGVNFYLGNSDLMVRFYRIRTREEYEGWIRDFGRVAEEKQAELEASGLTSPSQRTRAFFRMTLEERLRKPGESAVLFLRKSWDWLRPYPNPLFWPAGVVACVGLFYTVLSFLAAYGLLRSPRPGASFFAVALMTVTMAAHVAALVVWRYRIPYWDPVLLLYGVFGASRLLGQGSRVGREPLESSSRS